MCEASALSKDEVNPEQPGVLEADLVPEVANPPFVLGGLEIDTSSACLAFRDRQASAESWYHTCRYQDTR